MFIEKIYSGIWLPRTTLHMREFYQFLRYGKCDPALSKKEAEALRAALDVRDPSLKEGELDCIAATGGNDTLRYTEDGVVYLEGAAKGHPEDRPHQREFFLN